MATDAEKVEQLQVQLAGCSVAALGGTKDPAKQGDYGWSVAYQDVLDLRLKHDHLESLLAVAVEERDESKRLLEECWSIFSAEEMRRIEKGKGDLPRDPDLMKRISVFFRKTAAKGVE